MPMFSKTILMQDLHLLNDAESEMISGGLFLGAATNTTVFSPVNTATAVAGGGNPTLLGLLGGGNAVAVAVQNTNQNVANLLFSFG